MLTPPAQASGRENMSGDDAAVAQTRGGNFPCCKPLKNLETAKRSRSAAADRFPFPFLRRSYGEGRSASPRSYQEDSIYRRHRVLRPIRGNTRVLINAPCALADSSLRKSCENSERNLFLKKSKRGTFFGLACYVSRVAGADAMTALDSPDTPPRRRSPRLIVDFFEPRPFGLTGSQREEDLTARPSRPEMAPQRIDNIESAPENGMVSEASRHKMWYTGAQLAGRSESRRMTELKVTRVTEKGA
jgi:hypothetical protein